VLGEQLDVHPGLVVVAVEERLGRELQQVAVPRRVLGQQDHVIPLVLRVWRPVEA